MIERSAIDLIRQRLNQPGALPARHILHSDARILLQALDEKTRSLDAAMLTLADIVEENAKLRNADKAKESQ